MRFKIGICVLALMGACLAGTPHAQAAAGKAPVLGVAAGGTLQFDTPAKQEAYLQAAQDLGATWLRFDFTWNDIQRSNASTYDWTRYDALVDRAKAHGLQVLGMIGYAPAWARDPACAGDGMCRPRNPAEYGTFAGQVAKRYAARGVHHWEIWNEENTALFFRPASDPAYYGRMLSSAYQAIHAADPAAKVLTGGAAPSPTGGGNYTPVDFLAKLLASPGGSDFDILGHHPYCYAGSFDCPDTDAPWSAWSQMSQTPTSLRSLMTEHGAGAKQIWATEFGAPTGGDKTSVTEAHQASMLSDGIRRFSGYSWSGPLFIYSLMDRGTNPGAKEDWFGVLRADGSRKSSFGLLSSTLRTLTPAPAAPQPTPTPMPTTRAPAPTPTPTPTPSAPLPTGPVIAAVSPARGPAGTQVVLTGSGLAGRSPSVWFGDRAATAVQAGGDTTLRATAPAGGSGAVTVSVVVDGRAYAVDHAFTYVTKRRPPWWKRALNRVF